MVFAGRFDAILARSQVNVVRTIVGEHRRPASAFISPCVGRPAEPDLVTMRGLVAIRDELRESVALGIHVVAGLSRIEGPPVHGIPARVTVRSEPQVVRVIAVRRSHFENVTAIVSEPQKHPAKIVLRFCRVENVGVFGRVLENQERCEEFSACRIHVGTFLVYASDKVRNESRDDRDDRRRKPLTFAA